MKKLLLLLALPLLLAACGGASPTDVERDLYSKVDAGDVAGALALVTDDAVFEVLGCPPGGCKGKAAVKTALEGIVAQHPRHTIKSSKDSGDTATSQIEAVLDLAKAAGVQRIVANVKVTLRDGKIAQYQAQFDTGDQQTATVANFVRLTSLHRQLNEALNRGDVAGVMGLYTDDAVRIVGATCPSANPCVGKAAVQRDLERSVAGRIQVKILDLKVSGNTVTERAEVRNDAVRAAGVERFITTVTFAYRGDKVARQENVSDLSDPQTATFVNYGRLTGILRRHYDAVNKGDAAAAAAFFTEDATLVRGGCSALKPCKGKAEILRRMTGEVGNKAQFTLVEVQVSGNIITGRYEFQSVTVRNNDLERVVWKLTATVSDDKISQFIAELDVSDRQTAIFANYDRIAGGIDARNLALNRGDVAGVMAFYADDAVFQGLGLCAPAPCVGKAAIQKEIERQVADKTTLTGVSPSTGRVSGDISTGGRTQLRSDSIKAAGVERIIVWASNEVKGTKIASQRLEPDLTDAQTATYVNSLKLPADYVKSLLLVSTALRFYIGINTGDVAGALALFTDNPEYISGGCRPANPCRTKAEVQRALDGAVNFKTRFTILSTKVSGDTLTVRLEARATNFTNAGIERIITSHAVTLTGDKLSKLVSLGVDLSDPQTAAFEDFNRVLGVPNAVGTSLVRGDAASAVAFFTDDAVYEGFGLCAASPCKGKDAIQREIQRQISDKVTTKGFPESQRVSGDIFTARREIRSDSIKASGVERIIAALTVEVKLDKIVSWKYVLDSTDAQTATYLNYLKSQAR